MGDPECQPLMMRMDSDSFKYINAALNHSIDSMKPIQWNNKYSVCVIMASKGYPDKFKTGYINGLDKTEKDNLMVFHAGTKLNSQVK